jgi:TetR/AcrR family transcriptional repressor of mexJK operon
VKATDKKNQPARVRLHEERLAELLDVATEVFITEGFSTASTNEIARRANCSKTTLYSRFPTKEQLFLAVIERRMTAVFLQVTASLPNDAPVEETLYTFGADLIRLALSQDQIALVRVITMESAKFPDLGRRFYELGPKRGEEAIAAYFTRQIERRRLAKEDAHQMAQHFMSLVTGGPVRWYVLGFNGSSLTKLAVQKHLSAAVQTFMKAYGKTAPR